MNDKAIGIFDSGIGGLTVLQNLIKKLPNEKYIYIGDNEHCPYGDKTKEQLFSYACPIIDYFISEEVKLIVVACNTVSSNILPLLISKYSNVKIIGIIESTTSLLLKTNPKNVLVIATKATVTSHAYKKEIEKANSNVTVTELMTPLLVPLIESGSYFELWKVLPDYFNQVNTNFDSIVLGCTHYPIIKDMIEEIIGDKQIISSSDGIVNDVTEYLNENDLRGHEKKIQICTTGDVEEFVSSSINFFDYENNGEVKKLHLN